MAGILEAPVYSIWHKTNLKLPPVVIIHKKRYYFLNQHYKGG
jgi:hypothetical protein